MMVCAYGVQDYRWRVAFNGPSWYAFEGVGEGHANSIL